MAVLDDLDVYIIETIYTKKEVSTWDIARRYFEIKKDKSTREIHKKLGIIVYRLKMLAKAGLFNISKGDDGKNVYTLLRENIKVGPHRFADGRYYQAIHIKTDDKWIIFQK